MKSGNQREIYAKLDYTGGAIKFFKAIHGAQIYKTNIRTGRSLCKIRQDLFVSSRVQVISCLSALNVRVASATLNKSSAQILKHRGDAKVTGEIGGQKG